MPFGKWHGRPAREITRKMRVAHVKFITTRARHALELSAPTQRPRGLDGESIRSHHR